MAEEKRNRFLVVDADEAWRRQMADTLSAFGGVCTAADASSALAALRESKAWVGLVLDAVLGDGCGFDFLSRVRALGFTLPALILTGHHDRDRINRAHTLGVEFLCKPPDADSLTSFARRAVAYHWTRSMRLAATVDTMATEGQLTHRESEIVAAALANMPRRLVAEDLGISENTLKVQVRLLLAKCGMTNLDELADDVLRRALRGSGERRTAASVPAGKSSERKIS